jgi:hypothetical protein
VAKRARQKVRRTAAQKHAADVADLQAQRESIAAREASLRTQEASAQASPQRQLTAAAATVSDPIIRNEFEKVARALQDGAEAGLAAVGRPSAGGRAVGAVIAKTVNNLRSASRTAHRAIAKRDKDRAVRRDRAGRQQQHARAYGGARPTADPRPPWRSSRPQFAYGERRQHGAPRAHGGTTVDQVCRNFVHGRCTWGAGCHYAHRRGTSGEEGRGVARR